MKTQRSARVIILWDRYFERQLWTPIAGSELSGFTTRPWGASRASAAHFGPKPAGAMRDHAGIVHREMKPANIMVGEQAQVKLLDFGLAKLTEVEGSDASATTVTKKGGEGLCTEEGTIVETVAYMLQEQAEGKKVDARSDIFSFGSVLYTKMTSTGSDPMLVENFR